MTPAGAERRPLLLLLLLSVPIALLAMFGWPESRIGILVNLTILLLLFVGSRSA